MLSGITSSEELSGIVPVFSESYILVQGKYISSTGTVLVLPTLKGSGSSSVVVAEKFLVFCFPFS